MSRPIDDRDAVAVLDLLGELHEAPDTEQVSRVLVGRLRSLLRCDLVSYNDIDINNPGTRTWFEPELVPRPELEPAFDALQHEHPLVADYARTGDPGPRRMSDFIDLPDLQALDLWREVFRPLETNYQIAFAVLASRDRVIGLGINRWVHDFDDREMALAGLIQQHTSAAYDHARLRSLWRSRQPDALAELSTREREVLSLIALGRSTTQIAQLLFLSPRTVDKHAEHIRAKLKVTTRAEAVARWVAANRTND